MEDGGEPKNEALLIPVYCWHTLSKRSQNIPVYSWHTLPKRSQNIPVYSWHTFPKRSQNIIPVLQLTYTSKTLTKHYSSLQLTYTSKRSQNIISK